MRTLLRCERRAVDRDARVQFVRDSAELAAVWCDATAVAPARGPVGQLMLQHHQRLVEAAKRQDAAAGRSLLKQGASPNDSQPDGATALHWAAMSGDLELAEMLIVAGANVRATTRLGTYTPLYLASQQGHGPVIQALITAGADLKTGTPNGTTPLMVAAAAGEVAAVKVLIENGADVNGKDGVRAQTPLMYAAASNRAAVKSTS